MTTRQKLVAVLDESREILIELLVLLIFLPVAPKAWMDARKPREGEGEDNGTELLSTQQKPTGYAGAL